MSDFREPNLSRWLIDAGFKSFTCFSTANLEAIMLHPESSMPERVYACIVLNSWTWRRPSAMRMVDGLLEPMVQADIAKMLNGPDKPGVDRRLVSVAVSELKRRGLLRESKKLLYPVPVPDGPQAEEDSTEDPLRAPELTLEDFLGFMQTTDPGKVEAFRATKALYLEQWNEIRNGFKEYKKSATLRTNEPAAESPVCPEGTGQIVRKVETIEPPIIIGFKNSKRLVASCAETAPETAPERTPSLPQFRKALGELVNGGKLGRLRTPNAETVGNLVMAGNRHKATTLELIRFLAEKPNSRTWEDWGGAVESIKKDFPGWKNRQQPTADEMRTAAEPVPETEMLQAAYEAYRYREAEHFLTHKTAEAEYDKLIAKPLPELQKKYPQMTKDQLVAIALSEARAELLASDRVPLMTFEEFSKVEGKHAG